MLYLIPNSIYELHISILQFLITLSCVSFKGFTRLNTCGYSKMKKYKAFITLLFSSVIFGIFLFVLWLLASKIWDVHVQFEETEMENGKFAIKQAVTTAIDRCLTTFRSTDDGKISCDYDYGDLDYISLTFNVTTQRVAADLSRSMPFSTSMQCNNPKGSCHTLVLFLVGWWFGSRHSILFVIVMLAVVLYVCIFMYPVIMSIICSTKALFESKERDKEHADKYTTKVDLDANLNRSYISYQAEHEAKVNHAPIYQFDTVRSRFIDPKKPIQL